ncbi:MAG: DUF4266 domain-containing protein [Methylococcales bacterium]|nr:DUF4266 domain-containing protein [Methylococcales bacterium]
MKHLPNLKLTGAGLGLALLLCGCSEVQPWERGNLARNIMAIEMSPAQASLRQHNYASREAAGAASVLSSGGGCGCN